ncbi:unnamed protein product [Diabrotica balteata]|uniref:Uncharacterized protein n=1 Tax=Diabrotica balteata TaxID=107213 RepID=A0A9N9SV07_DIABA|nr:unnamed protein product [Diabrotica balteata]
MLSKAYFLNPRFKTYAFSNEDNLKRVQNQIQDELDHLIKYQTAKNRIFNKTKENLFDLLNNTENFNMIWQDFDTCVKHCLHVTSPTEGAIAEIKVFSMCPAYANTCAHCQGRKQIPGVDSKKTQKLWKGESQQTESEYIK